MSIKSNITINIFLTRYNKLLDKISSDLGNIISKLHSGDLIHGDLTPSNILLKIKEDTGSELLNNAEKIILEKKDYDDMHLIDFGLSSVAINTVSSMEDKAVDLYVLKRAIISSNPKSEELFEKAMEIYQKKCKNGEDIINRYKKVEMRERKKLCFG